MTISFLKHKIIIQDKVIIKIDEANFCGVPENRVQHIVQAFQRERLRTPCLWHYTIFTLWPL